MAALLEKMDLFLQSYIIILHFPDLAQTLSPIPIKSYIRDAPMQLHKQL